MALDTDAGLTCRYWTSSAAVSEPESTVNRHVSTRADIRGSPVSTITVVSWSMKPRTVSGSL